MIEKATAIRFDDELIAFHPAVELTALKESEIKWSSFQSFPLAVDISYIPQDVQKWILETVSK